MPSSLKCSKLVLPLDWLKLAELAEDMQGRLGQATRISILHLNWKKISCSSNIRSTEISIKDHAS